MHAAVRYGKIYTASIAIFKSVALETLMIRDYNGITTRFLPEEFRFVFDYFCNFTSMPGYS
jgi:hypothetical protein